MTEQAWQHSYKGPRFNTNDGNLGVGQYVVYEDHILANTEVDGEWQYPLDFDVSGMEEVQQVAWGYWNVYSDGVTETQVETTKEEFEKLGTVYQREPSDQM